jgi:molybdopterin-guanine dinucleotide biosynthesis protein MobB
MKTPPIISVIGWHNTGKTTFLVGLLRELKRRGLRVATIKHSGGHLQLDREGTDTWRFAQAGSDVVAITAPHGLAWIEQRADEPELTELIRRLPPDIDLVITEGYKRAATLKIEVLGSADGEGRIAPPEQLLALVCAEPPPDETVPCYAPDDAAGVADLLQARKLIPPHAAAQDDSSVSSS